MEKRSRGVHVKDVVIILVFLILLVFQIRNQIVIQKETDIGNIINSVLLLLLAFVGFEDIAHYCNWDVFVPNFYIQSIEKKESDRFASLINCFFENDSNYIKIYSEEKVQFLLSQMKITVEQLDQIRLELINMRCAPLRTIVDAEERIKLYIKDSKYPNIVNQRNLEQSSLTYNEVNYFINFYDIMFEKNYQTNIAAALVLAIKESGININSIDRIVVPYDSNLLLAIGVSNILGPPVVKMRKDKGRIIRSQPWDGDLPSNSRVAIVHDVLVKSDQVVLALDKLPDTCCVLGIFCLVIRTEWKGSEKLARHLKSNASTKDAKIVSILTLDEDGIRHLRND